MAITSGLALAGAASIGSGIMGHLSNMSAQERAETLNNQAVQEWLKLNIPDPAQQKLALQKFVSTGEFTPELESAVKQADTELQKVQVDPKLKEARLRGLGALERQGYGGESIEDAAALEKAMIESGARNRANDQGIVASMERRGQLGSGLELAARQGAVQAEGDRNSTNALDLEMNRRKRAFDSIMGAGELAGDIQRDDYAMKSDAAKAQDRINEFNTLALQGVNTRNVGAKNNAGMYNLDRSQTLSDKNVALGNFEQQYNKELAQQKFENEAKKKAGLSGQYGQAAGQAVQSGQNAAQMWGQIAGGVGQLGLAGAKYYDDRDKKKAGTV